jgi:hypothetical protein
MIKNVVSKLSKISNKRYILVSTAKVMKTYFVIKGSDVFKVVKNDLIAELKLSHNVGGVSKLKSEQAKLQEEEEKELFKKFLLQFTMENYLSKVKCPT